MRETALPFQAMETNFSYTSVELIKSESIGAGSYGVVCKARCDKLICAAKLLYSIFFDVPDQDQSHSLDHRTPLNRFRYECQLLSRVKHPNIVQYLGTYTAQGTNAVALLMELMNESLTHFLEKEPKETLPLHIQIDLGHDVILALTYLHSNDIIHRDLSSNNVLLTASLRAKVSDFGMSTIMNKTGGKKSHTVCPGTASYMPPEALDELHSVCKKSLDCFSFGILLVQINSRLFPHPDDRFKTIQMRSPYNQSEMISARIAVPELERRQSHVRMMDSYFPLRPIVLDCLKDLESARPAASEIFESLEALKATSLYRESRDNPDGHKYRTMKELHETIELLHENQEELEQQLSFKDEVLLKSAKELKRVSKMLEKKEKEADASCQNMEAEINNLRSTLEEVRRESEHYRNQMRLQDNTIADLQFVVSNREDYIEDHRKLRKQLDKHLETSTSVLRENREEWINNSHPMKPPHSPDSEAQILSLKHQLQPLMESKLKESTLSPKLKESTLSPKLKESTLSPKLKESTLSPKLKKVEQKSSLNLKLQIEWTSANRAPALIQTGSTATSKDRVYCRPANSNYIHELSLCSMKWRTLKMCPSNAYTIATVHNSLVAIGGTGTAKLLNLIENSKEEIWKEIYPPMNIERSNSAAAYNNGKLIVAGGFGASWAILSDVEVFDIYLCTWTTVHPLPHPIYSASATICDDSLYVVGGYFGMTRGNFSVVACPMNTLTTSSDKLDSGNGDAEQTHWRKVTDLPVCRSACVKIRGKLSVIGGRLENGSHSSSIYIYDSKCNMWVPVSNLALPRSECHAAVINDKRIVIIGGDTCDGLTSDIEIGHIIVL